MESIDELEEEENEAEEEQEEREGGLVVTPVKSGKKKKKVKTLSVFAQQEKVRSSSFRPLPPLLVFRRLFRSGNQHEHPNNPFQTRTRTSLGRTRGA